MLINREGDRSGIYGGAVRGWEYGQALALGDRSKAERVRGDVDEWLAAKSRELEHFDDGHVRFELVSHALRHGEIEGAARELTVWFRGMDVTNLDVSHLGDRSREGNHLRVACFTLFRSAIAFLELPMARTHPSAPAIDKAARYLGNATQHEMMMDLRHKWQTLMRSPQLD